MKNIGFDRCIFDVAGHFAAFDENLLVEGEADRGAGANMGDRCRGIPGLDARDPGSPVARREQQLVANLQPAAFDAPSQDSPVVEFVDILQWQAQGRIVVSRRRGEPGQRLEHRRPAVPGQSVGRCRDVVAVARRNRDHAGRHDVNALQIAAVLGLDGPESLRVVADQIHLVDHNRHLVNAEQLEQIAMVARLAAHALVGVDEQ